MTNTEQRLTALEKLLFETDQYRNSGGELPYKVYTALITQNGSDDEALRIYEGNLTIGVTYLIDVSAGGDWTNVGSPNNNSGTYFVATGTVPNSWGDGTLIYNACTPIVRVLENTIGNIWWTYATEGIYYANCSGCFVENKTAIITSPVPYEGLNTPVTTTRESSSIISVSCSASDSVLINNSTIEIRVYP